MTLHVRQPLPQAAIETLIEETLFPAPRFTPYRNGLKRALDIAIVLIALPAVLLLIAICALLIAMDGHNPFYSQLRVGQNDRTFRMWKLRSMVPNADALLADYLAADPVARAEWDHAQKLRHDPRITPIGHFIRKSSLDELPQLLNVLTGDMSLVGPRPMMLNQKEIYPGTAYYALRPGITGFWQTSVRNESSFAERADFDTAYLRQVSLATDLRVLLKTVRVVAHGTGY
ncbi:sugar transferase [Sagittula sp. SSi028]|uniref:sugar transferase n=1 Tax=Sagittula sp. SSi028 TaxID=3400636 RepID=UPI003AF42E94